MILGMTLNSPLVTIPKLVAANGVPFSKLRLWDCGVSWAEIETSQNVFNWKVLDAIIALAQQNKLDLLYTFGNIPKWLGTQNIYLPFLNFVSALMAHTGKAIEAFELWNEPNLAQYWTSTPANLGALLRGAYHEIKAANAAAIVVGPGGSGGLAVDTFMLQYFQANPPVIFQDVFNYHAYLGDGQRNANGMSAILNDIAVKKNSMNIPNQPTWFCEGSWGHDADYNPVLTPDEKAAYTSTQVLLMKLHGVARYYWYAMDSQRGWGCLQANGISTLAGQVFSMLGKME